MSEELASQPDEKVEKQGLVLETSLNRRLDSASLVYLNASNSKIVLLDFLVNLPNVEVLILSNNSIESLEYIWLCQQLFHLDVSYNKIKSIESLGRFAVMGTLNLVGNRITWTELERICHMQIVDAYFSENRELVKDTAHYRLHIIDCLPYLWSLDGRLVTALERSRVKDFFQTMEMSSKPLRHKLSGLVFKQTNNHRSELLSSRAVAFLRRFNITISHTTQLDAQRLLYMAEMLSADLSTLNSPSWIALPTVPQVLGDCPQLFVDTLRLAKVDIAFGIDLLSSLITSLLFDIPTELVAYIVVVPKMITGSSRSGTPREEQLSPSDFFNIPGILRLRLASLLLSNCELDFADHDKVKAVLEGIHDSAFFGISNHILLNFLKTTPTDPKIAMAENESLPRPQTFGLRQCSVLFGARTLFKFLKTIFASANNKTSEIFSSLVVSGAALLTSDLMAPIVTLVKNEDCFQHIDLSKLMSAAKSQPSEARSGASPNTSTKLAVPNGADNPSSPIESSVISNIAKELHSLYTEIVDCLPVLYDSAAQVVAEYSSKIGSVGTRNTPIGPSQALLARPAPTPIRGRDALNVGRHVPLAGPPALRARPPQRRPKIGDCVLVAVQHTGRIIAVPDPNTVCVQLDVVPDKVGLHPPGTHPIRNTVNRIGSSYGSSSVRKAAPTLTAEYSYMYFNVADLSWDASNKMWRSHISDAPVSTAGKLYLNRATASNVTPEGPKKPLSSSAPGSSLTLLSRDDFDKEIHEVGYYETLLDREAVSAGPFESDDLLILNDTFPSRKEIISNESATSISPISFLNNGSALETAFKTNRKGVSTRTNSAQPIRPLIDDTKANALIGLNSILKGRVSRSANQTTSSKHFRFELKRRRALLLESYEFYCKNEKNSASFLLPPKAPCLVQQQQRNTYSTQNVFLHDY